MGETLISGFCSSVRGCIAIAHIPYSSFALTTFFSQLHKADEVGIIFPCTGIAPVSKPNTAETTSAAQKDKAGSITSRSHTSLGRELQGKMRLGFQTVPFYPKCCVFFSLPGSCGSVTALCMVQKQFPAEAQKLCGVPPGQEWNDLLFSREKCTERKLPAHPGLEQTNCRNNKTLFRLQLTFSTVISTERKYQKYQT